MLGLIWIQTVCHYTTAVEASFQCLDILAIHGKYHTIFHVIAPFILLKLLFGANCRWHWMNSFFACREILHTFCRLLISPKINFFQKNFQYYHQSVKHLGFRSGPTFCGAWSESKLFAMVSSRRQKVNTGRLRVNSFFPEKIPEILNVEYFSLVPGKSYLLQEHERSGQIYMINAYFKFKFQKAFFC